MRRIRISLRGGLGNQLFQISAGIYFANNLNANLLIDPQNISQHLNPLRRDWSSHINLEEIFDLEQMKIRPQILGNCESMFYKLKDNLNKTRNIVSEEEVKKFVRLSRTIVLQDYFISKFYPKHTVQRDLSKREFIRGKGLLSDLQKFPGERVAAVHVRLGDSKGIKERYLSADWYLSAVQKLAQAGATSFHIYSDEIEEARTFFVTLEDQFDFSYPEKERMLNPIDLLTTLSSYQYFVSSKSTLSWWASFLGLSNKHVVCQWEDRLRLDSWQFLK